MELIPTKSHSFARNKSAVIYCSASILLSAKVIQSVVSATYAEVACRIL
jgi:hypothetical protein